MENNVSSWLVGVLVVMGLMSLRLLLRRQRQQAAMTDSAAAAEPKPPVVVVFGKLVAIFDVAIVIFMVSMLVLLYRENPDTFFTAERGTIALALTIIAIAIFRRWKRL